MICRCDIAYAAASFSGPLCEGKDQEERASGTVRGHVLTFLLSVFFASRVRPVSGGGGGNLDYTLGFSVSPPLNWDIVSSRPQSAAVFSYIPELVQGLLSQCCSG